MAATGLFFLPKGNAQNGVVIGFWLAGILITQYFRAKQNAERLHGAGRPFRGNRTFGNDVKSAEIKILGSRSTMDTRRHRNFRPLA